MDIARARTFLGADIESDYDLLMMTFHLRLKRISELKHTRLKFDLEKLKDSNVLEAFQAMIGGKFAPPTIMNDEDTDMDSMITPPPFFFFLFFFFYNCSVQMKFIP